MSLSVAAAQVRGFAVAVHGMFGWQASCPTCRWSSSTRPYKGDASLLARAHNAEKHPAEASRIRTQHRCTRCGVPVTPETATLQADERALGMTLADVEACDRCRPIVEENYGLALSRAMAMRGAA